MATKIRLKRTGARGNPNYRVVIMDAKRPRDGRTVEELGYYCPTSNPPLIHMDVNRALYWLSVGAQPTETVRSLMGRFGVIEAFEAGVEPGDMPQPEPVRPAAVAAEMAEEAVGAEPGDAQPPAVEEQPDEEAISQDAEVQDEITEDDETQSE